MNKLPEHERARAERLLVQATGLLKTIKRLILQDPADCRAARASAMLTALQAIVMVETILNVLERIIKRREAETERHLRQ